MGQYFWYPKPTELYRIADAVEYGAVFSIRTVAFWAETLASTRVLYFAMFVGIGLLVTPRHFKNAAKYEWRHGFNPDKIADQVEPQARWYIIVIVICALPMILATSGPVLTWTALLPMVINPHTVQKYAAEMEGVWREFLLLISCIIVFACLELTQ